MAIIILTCIATGWTGWFWKIFWTEPEISRMPQIREWVGGLMMLSDRGDQVVCTVGQTDDHSSPDHTMRIADVEWNSLEPQANLLMHPSAPKGSVLVLHGLIWSEKAICKTDLLIYSNCVTVSGRCLSVATIISNKIDFNSCADCDGFPKSSHILFCRFTL